MPNPTLSHAVVLPYVGDPSGDPNLFLLSELQATLITDSTAVSTVTSQVASAAASGALDSIPVSTAASKAESASTRASVADSKAVSDSANTSIADSKALSVSVNTSKADSKAVSNAAFTASPSTVVSIADSKAVSVSKTVPSSRTVTTLSGYQTNNAVYNVKDFGAAADGATDDSTVIQACITAAQAAGGGGIVYLPAGQYRINVGLFINGAVTLCGAGGPGDTDGGFATLPQTMLDYQGTGGIGITIVGDPLQGIKNVHLRDFMISGTVNAVGGILVGSAAGGAQQVNHSSIKNVTCSAFTGTNAYGFSFERMLTSVMENCLARSCYFGFLFPADASVTTLTFLNCHGYACTRNGLRMSTPAGVTNCSFHGFVAESCDYAGVYIDGAQFVNFFNLYCEANNLVGDTAPVMVLGSGASAATRINFYSPYIQDPFGGTRAFDFANASKCLIFYPTLEWASTDWCRVTASTANCTAYLSDDLGLSSVTSNAVGRMQVLGLNSVLRHEEGTWTPTDASGAGLTFASVSATYERVGRQVTARCAFTFPATADASAALVGGLPYTVANASDARQGFVSLTSESTFARPVPTANATTVQLTTATGANITNATMSGDTCWFTVIYRV